MISSEIQEGIVVDVETDRGVTTKIVPFFISKYGLRKEFSNTTQVNSTQYATYKRKLYGIAQRVDELDIPCPLNWPVERQEQLFLSKKNRGARFDAWYFYWHNGVQPEIASQLANLADIILKVRSVDQRKRDLVDYEGLERDASNPRSEAGWRLSCSYGTFDLNLYRSVAATQYSYAEWITLLDTPVTIRMRMDEGSEEVTVARTTIGSMATNDYVEIRAAAIVSQLRSGVRPIQYEAEDEASDDGL